MDTFIEQLVEIKNGPKVKITKISIWTVCSLLAAGLIIFAIFNRLLAVILLFLAAAAFFCAWYMCGQLNNEFEYIITNREIDIDRIVNKKKRIRMANFECSDIENIEKYDPKKHCAKRPDDKNVYFGCTPDENSLAFTVRHPKKGFYILVLSPNDELKEAIRKFVAYDLKKKI